jgi:hypothetical protein
MRSFIPTDELKTRGRDDMNVSRKRAGAAENYIISAVARTFEGGYNGPPQAERLSQLNSL